MDHEVHINNGERDPRPIIFYLLPGEETIFNLKVINHGPPANISLQASSPVFKAVRLKKPDHNIISEEIIPVLARMPMDKGRLDGEIILSAEGSESRVPITLLCDSGDIDDLNDTAIMPDVGEDIMAEDEDGEREGEYEDDEYEEDSRRDEPYPAEDEGDIERDSRKKQSRISFSMDADLERYRASRGRKGLGGGAAGSEDGAGEEGDEERRAIPRYSTRIDDSFVDKGSRKGQPPSESPHPSMTLGPDDAEQEPPGMNEDQALAPEEGRERGEEQLWQEEQISSGQGPQLGYSQLTDIESQEIIHQAERDELNPLEDVDNEEYGLGPEYEGRPDDESPFSGYAFLERLDAFSLTGLVQAVPAIILLTLIAALVLTFVTETVPEFPGALASSILMVTLIIYGAARLLKA